jgi:hypothetical protein
MDRYTHMIAPDVAGDLDKLPDLPLPFPGGAKPEDGGQGAGKAQTGLNASRWQDGI